MFLILSYQDPCYRHFTDVLNFDVIFQTSNNSLLTAYVWGSMMIMNGELEINVKKTAVT